MSATAAVVPKASPISPVPPAASPAPPAPVASRLVPVASIDESPTNPRTHFDQAKLGELAESVRQYGVLQPILLRPKGSRFELVAGHRRFRAAKIAKLESIPAIVQELSDKQVLEVQVVENLQRADLSPLEEAEGYARLIREHGYDADTLAARIKKSRSYIYGRMKLAELCPQAKKALAEDAITHSVALLIARIPDAKVQQAATAELLNRVEGVTFREAARIIDHQFLLRLEEAPWKLDDATLVPAAGPCTACPFNSRNQDFVAEGDGARRASADVCTKPSCHAEKGDAAWQRVSAEALKSGATLLPKGEAVFSKWGGFESAKYERLDQSAYEYGEYDKTYRKLLPKAFVPPVVLVRNPKDGQPVELVRKDDLVKAMKAAGFAKRGPSYAADKAQRAEAEKRKLERTIETAVIAAIRPKLAALKVSTPMLRILGKALAFSNSHRMEDVFKRRGLKWPGWDGRDRAFVQFVDGLSDVEIVQLGAELMLSFTNVEQRGTQERALVRELAKLAGVDAAAIDARMRAEAKAKKAAKEAKEAKVKAAPKVATKPAAKVKAAPVVKAAPKAPVKRPAPKTVKRPTVRAAR